MQNRFCREKITEWSITTFSLIISGLFVFIVWQKCGIYFETNDDRTITEILAGVLALEPDFHTVHVNALLSLPLSCFYRIFPGVPWYGAFLISLHIYMYFALLSSLLKERVRMVSCAAAVAVTAGLFLVNMGMLAQIQYTSTAAMMAGIGYAVLVLEEEKTCGWRKFLLLEGIACLLRDQAMLMIQPIGMAVFAGWILARPELGRREKVIRIARVCGVVGAIWCIAFCGKAVVYHDSEWRAYLRANSAREEIFDYGEKPLYEEVANILENYGVTEAEYNAFVHYTVMEGSLPASCIIDLAQYCKNSREPSISFGQAVILQLKNYFSTEYRRINRVTLLLWLLLVLCCVLGKNMSRLLPAGFLLLGRTFVWTVLLYRGRMPQRVSFPLFACESLLLTVLIWRALPKRGKVFARVLIVVVLLFLGREVYLCGQTQYRYAVSQNQGQETYFAGMKELQDYCGRHPERQYYVEAISLAYYTGSALETEVYSERDYLPTGCWYASSPAMNERIYKFMAEREKGIYLIIYENGSQRNHPAVSYFEERTSSEPVQVDSFTLSHGGGYVVYYYENEKNNS